MGNTKFAEDDPLRYLHVPRRKRINHDEEPDANAITDDTGADDDFDRDEVRARGEVVDGSQLQ